MRRDGNLDITNATYSQASSNINSLYNLAGLFSHKASDIGLNESLCYETQTQIKMLEVCVRARYVRTVTVAGVHQSEPPAHIW